jgi:hypothetical protein
MEFDKPSTKYMFISIIGLFIVAISVIMFKMVQYDRAEAQLTADRRAACITLNPKFGDLFVVRSGFYEGQLLEATAFVYGEYVRGNIVQDLRPLGLVKTAENITIECPMLKTEETND